MNPVNYRYTEQHEWLCPESEDKGKIGLTDYAQLQLGDIVFLDLPEPGTKVEKAQKIGEIESVKAVSEFFSPASGLVSESNQNAIDNPKLVNEDPYGAGWLVKLDLNDSAESNDLMNSEEYGKLTAKLCQEES